MGEEKAFDVGPSGIEMAYERFGDQGAPPVLLVHGGGAQMISWPDGFCAGLVDRGVRVVRFDNRDTGRSTRLGPQLPGGTLARAGHPHHRLRGARRRS
jgi:pimeloyl-ACP methyl ester carboxylesterase